MANTAKEMTTVNEKSKVIPEGAIFTITAGEHSDNEFSDHFTLTVLQALTNINTTTMQNEYMAENPEQKKQYNFDPDKLIEWITNKKEYAKEIDFFQLHIGNYLTTDFSLIEIGK